MEIGLQGDLLGQGHANQLRDRGHRLVQLEGLDAEAGSACVREHLVRELGCPLGRGDDLRQVLRVLERKLIRAVE